MPASMTSRERIMAALSRQEPDRVPIAMRGMEPLNHLWNDPFERVMVLRERFGVDDFLYLSYAWVYEPCVVENRQWKTYGDHNQYPLLVTDYHTPAGTLHAEVFMSDDYYTDRLNLEADQLVPRMVVRTIHDCDDVEKFRYLLAAPEACDLEAWRDTMQRYIDFGRQQGVPVGLYIPSVSGIAMKNVGPLEIVMRAMDGDRMVLELLDALTDWALRWIDYGARFKPDIIYYSACYESTDFWSPALFRRLFAPVHRQLAHRAHAYGMKYIIYMTTGVEGLIEQFKGLGVDALYGWDSTPPGSAGFDISRLKQVLGDEVALWGGISPTFVVERGTTQQVREDVRRHIQALAPGGGYILCTAGSVYFEDEAGFSGKKRNGTPHTSRAYRNLLTLFQAGLEYGRYPIAL